METLLDTEYTRINFINLNTEEVYVIFNSLLGEDVSSQRDEELVVDFYSLSKTKTTFFITDKTMSWGNKVEWEIVADIIKTYTVNKKIICIGLSMGGSNAIISSKFLTPNKVIAFNPQYTIHPNIFQGSEYMNYAKKINVWKYKTIGKSYIEGINYYIFIGEHDVADKKFIHKIPSFCKVFNFGPNYGHNLPKELKDEGRLKLLFDLVDKDDILSLKAML